MSDHLSSSNRPGPASSHGGNAAQSATIAGLIDALLSYAIDPTQWETLAAELDRRGASLSTMDVHEFLTHLSRAESLAWQIKGEADDVSESKFIYILLDDAGRVVAHARETGTIAPFIDDLRPGTHLRFTDDTTQSAFLQAKAELTATGSAVREHVLLELAAAGHNSRYGYLLQRAHFPAALKLAAANATHAILFAQDNPTEKLKRVVQASFGLTAAEVAVTMALAGGRTIKEVAQHLSIAVNTVRNHLQSVFEKSGVNRQGDLILVITQLSVILAGTNASTLLATPESDIRVSDRDYPPHRFTILPDGRRIAFRVYGSSGHPVVYLHESAGTSRLLPGTAQLADELGLTLYAIERPGFGFSDSMPDYNFTTVARDIVHVMDQLGLQQVSLVGLLAGAAYAIELAARYPERVTHLFCISGRPPAEYAPGRNSALAVLRDRLAEQPWLLKTFFNILRNRVSADLNKRLLRKVYGASASDRKALDDNPLWLEHMGHYTLESLTVTANGMVDEIRAFSEPHLVDVSAISMPVTIWHGEDDALSPASSMQHFLRNTHCEVKLFPATGSLLIFAVWRRVLQHLRDAAGTPR